MSLLHQRALQTTGGSRSLLFEPNPASGDLQATSGIGLDELPNEAWRPTGDEATFVSHAFAGRAALAVEDVADVLPSLHARLRTDSAILVPLVSETRRVGLLAIGLPSGAHLGTVGLERSDVLPGFVLALELSRLRQREEFEREIRDLLDLFSEQLASTLDLSRALEPLCVSATRLFAADRTTVWLHDRESRSLVPLASSEATNPSRANAVRADDPIAPAAAALRTQRAGLASSRAEPTSVLTVPLRGCRRALGTVVFEGVRVEPGDDISVLNRADELGRQLSSAIEAVQLLGVVGEARRELEQLFASIALPIVVVDPQGLIVRANQAFATAVRRPAESLAQQPLESCVGPELVSWLDDPQHAPGATAEGELTDSVLGGPYVVTVTDLVAEDGSHSGRVIVAKRL